MRDERDDRRNLSFVNADYVAKVIDDSFDAGRLCVCVCVLGLSSFPSLFPPFRPNTEDRETERNLFLFSEPGNNALL